jgi:hypothetical protein
VNVNKSNHLQFKCARTQENHQISLAMNLNDHQFAAVTLPMPVTNFALTRPASPWFVDIGARLTADGTLEGSVAKVTLYDHQ